MCVSVCPLGFQHTPFDCSFSIERHQDRLKRGSIHKNASLPSTTLDTNWGGGSEHKKRFKARESAKTAPVRTLHGQLLHADYLYTRYTDCLFVVYSSVSLGAFRCALNVQINHSIYMGLCTYSAACNRDGERCPVLLSNPASIAFCSGLRGIRGAAIACW